MPSYKDRKIIPYTPEQMFDLVADVGSYPKFLPWCIGARVRSRDANELRADLTIGFGLIRESFGSIVALDRPRQIRVTYERGPFKYLQNQWDFSPHPQGAQIDFFVDFEFRSALLQATIGMVFGEAVKQMVTAFLRRARNVYGIQGVKQAAPPSAAPKLTAS
jgi:coenzyme Q-binding protein COQ10